MLRYKMVEVAGDTWEIMKRKKQAADGVVKWDRDASRCC